MGFATVVFIQQITDVSKGFERVISAPGPPIRLCQYSLSLQILLYQQFTQYLQEIA